MASRSPANRLSAVDDPTVTLMRSPLLQVSSGVPCGDSLKTIDVDPVMKTGTKYSDGDWREWMEFTGDGGQCLVAALFMGTPLLLGKILGQGYACDDACSKKAGLDEALSPTD